MTRLPQPDLHNHYLSDYILLVAQSLQKLTGLHLADSTISPKAQAQQIYEAPYVLLTHNATTDPIFQYANQKGLALFELTWDELTTLHSKYSAEPQNREAREKLLQEVALKGYTDHYSGVRISKTGKRFEIRSAIVWNITDTQGTKIGQAAMFKDFHYL